MRLSKAECAAAAAVISAAAAVTVSGIKLLKRYTDHMMKRAASHFEEEEPLSWPDDAEWDEKSSEED